MITDNLLVEILCNKCLDIGSINAVACSSKENRDIVLKNINYITYELFKKNFPKFIEKIIDKEVCFSGSNLHTYILFDILSRITMVSNMKKGQQYQRFLIPVFNGSIFANEQVTNICLKKEYNTLVILQILFEYVETFVSKDKTNLSIWALYPFLEYICMKINDKDSLVFSIKEDVVLKAQELKQQLKRTRDCSCDIKYRVQRLIDFIIENSHS